MLMVYLDMPYITEAKRYDLMLTPQFYIYTKEPLPVRYTHQATNLAPAILDDLTEDRVYNYAAIKSGDEWMLFAYDIEKIANFLESKGLSSSHINKIYFTQQLDEKLSNPISLNEKMALADANSTVVMLPKMIMEDAVFSTFDNSMRPKVGFGFDHGYDSYISQKQAIILSVLLAIFAIGYIIEGMGYQDSIAKLGTSVESAKEKYPSLKNKSNLVLRSLYKTGYKVDSKQRKIRDRLKDISQLTSKDSKINRLTIDEKSYQVEISAGKKSMKKLKEYAKSKSLAIKSSKDTLKLKGAL